MYLTHEVHVDDERLRRSRDRQSWEASRALVSRIVEVAESRACKLALRFRWPFAQATKAFEGPDNCIVRWQAAGHEIGAHAHRRGVQRAVLALRAAGVQQLRAVVPGLIRSSRAECLRTLAACQNLGLDLVSDQPQFGAFAYSGLTPWRPAPDLRGPGDGPFVFVDCSVNPHHWGLLKEKNGSIEQCFGLSADNFDRLLALLDAQLRLPRPHPVVYFGYPFHEHQHGRSMEDLRPDERSLMAWDSFLQQALRRPVTPATPQQVAEAWRAAEGLDAAVPQSPPRLLPSLDPLDLRHDLPSYLRQRLTPDLGPLGAALQPLRGLRRQLAHRRRELRSQGRVMEMKVGERSLKVLRVGPELAQANVLLSHAGFLGGTALFLEPFGLDPSSTPGLAYWAWDRSGTGATQGRTWLAPGNPWHAEEAEALFQLAAASGAPCGWLTFSGGVVAPLLALKAAEPAFFFDGEAPSDRRSLSPGGLPGLLHDPVGGELAHLSMLDDAQWTWREPYRLVGALKVPYHRLQAEQDHAHNRSALHARIMLEHAPPGALLNGRPWDGQLRLLPGRLEQHGGELARLLLSWGTPAAGASR